MSEPLTWEELLKMQGQRVRIELSESVRDWHPMWYAACCHPEGLCVNVIFLRLYFTDHTGYNWEFSENGVKEENIKVYPFEPSPNVSNKGRDKCLWCRCATEKRRDFKDFSIREFCPRCKK